MTPTFYRIGDTAHFGTPPDGAAILDMDSAAPFQGLALSRDAIAEVLRLHRNRHTGGRRADLTGANLRGADLTDANLRGADLTGADLTYADLTRANLRGADLRGADLTDAYLTRANLADADLTYADLTRANLADAIGIASAEEEAATLAACVEAIAREPDHHRQDIWHGYGYDPAAATEVGSCGTAHCLAGWAQALLPLGDSRRKLDAQTCGAALLPRAATAGWFSSDTHPDLQAAINAARAKLAGGQ